MSHQLFADDIRFYQRVLKISGDYAGAIDGVWGPQMDAADQAFTEDYEAAKQQLGAFDARSESNIQTLIPSAQREARRFLAKAQAGFPNLVISDTVRNTHLCQAGPALQQRSEWQSGPDCHACPRWGEQS